MNKVWPVLTIAVALGIGLLLIQNSTAKINFDDLETECRLQDNHEANFELQENNKLRFDGNYPVENIETDVSQSFEVSENSIKLRISNTDVERESDFEHTCLGSVVYDGTTRHIEPGTYMMEIYHNDRQVEKNILRVK